MNKKLLMALCGAVSSSALFANEGAAGHYVMVRSGFGSLKANDKITCSNEAVSATLKNKKPDYSSHKNLSVALGTMYNVWDFAGINIDCEFMGAYAKFKQDKLVKVNNFASFLEDLNFEGHIPHVEGVHMAFKNVRMLGVMANVTYEQYLLDWASVCIAGGIGCGYAATKVALKLNSIHENMAPLGAVTSRYLHAGTFMYNFAIFGRINWQSILFDFGYRHVAAKQIGNCTSMGCTWDKQANLKSDQFFIGAGLQF